MIQDVVRDDGANRSQGEGMSGVLVQFTEISFTAPFAAAERCDILCLQWTLTYMTDTTCTDKCGFGVKGFCEHFQTVLLRRM